MFNSRPIISVHTYARGDRQIDQILQEHSKIPSPSHENWSIGTAFDFAKPVSPSPFDFNFAVIHLFPYPIEEQIAPPKMLPYPCLCVCAAEGVPLLALSCWSMHVRASRRPRFESSQPRLEIHTQPRHTKVACALPHHVLCGSVPFFGNGTPVERESFPFRRCPLSSSLLSSPRRERRR